MIVDDTVDHRKLDCGIELAVLPLPARNVAAMHIRYLAGYAFEAGDALGGAHVLDEVITKGTARRDGRALNDAFDEIGVSHGSYVGRETFGFSAIGLAEFIDRCIDLHAEFLLTPSFPEEACEVAIDLTRQELAALHDDPGELAKKHLHRQAYGPFLGRHPLGEAATLERLTRDDLMAHWQRFFHPHRMMVSLVGNVDPERIAERFEAAFARGSAATRAEDNGEVPTFPIEFQAVTKHVPQDTEQQQILLCFPGASRTDEDYPVGEVLLGVLSGGMSSRLFAEVREKQGLVYWIDAWSDHPRGGGLVHVGASSTPENADRTLETILREIDRVAEDLTQEEVDRAITGIVAQAQTRGDISRVRTNRIADDLFYHHRPLSREAYLRRVRQVTVDDIHRYLEDHPRDRLSIVSLGPKGNAR